MRPYPIYLVGAYLACELAANVTAGKITALGPFALNAFGKAIQIGPFFIPAAVYIFTLTYTLLDLINHGLGKAEARRVVTAGFIANAILAGYSLFAVALPPAPFWPLQDAFRNVIGNTPRIVLASLLAYYVSSNIDVSAYAWLSRRFSPWARVLLSNAVGLGADTAIFVTVAFAGVTALAPIMIGQYAVKMAVTLLSIPLIYLMRRTHQRTEAE